MTISVIQTANLDNPGGGVSFTANVTAGNSVILLASAYNSSGATMGSSAPTYNGSPVAGAVKLIDQQSPFSGFAAYGAVWLLPSLAGGAKGPFAVTFTGTTGTSEYQVFEVAGLGASPTVGPSSPGSGSSSSASSGTMSALTGSALVVGFGAANNNVFVNPPATAPWTAFFLDTGFDASGYQVASSGALTWTPAMTTSAQWTAMIAAVYGPVAALGTATVGGTVWRRSGRRGSWRNVAGAPAPVVTLGVPTVGGVVRRRANARAAWKGISSPGATQKAVVGGVIRRRTAARGVWRGLEAPPGLGATATGGVVRRRSGARAVWRGGVGTLGPQPKSFVGGLVRRRSAARGLQRSVHGSIEAIAPLSYVTGGFYRQRPVVRVTWRGVSGSVGAPVIVPVAVVGGLVRRRVTMQAVWRGLAQTARMQQAVVGGLIRRRTVTRVVWRGGTGTLGPQPKSAIGGLVRRRTATRVEWRGGKGTQAPPPPRGTVPSRTFVMRRRGIGAVWRGVTPVGANSVVVNGPPLEIVLGQPGWDWETGPVGFWWGTGQPGTGWATGPVGIG